MRYPNRWTVGEWTFYEVADHGFGAELADKPMFAYATGTVETPRGEPKLGEFYQSLEHAMAAAIAEKYTGPRGAGGTGVGTAADWFMRMIGADALTDAGTEGTAALRDAIEGSDGFPATGPMGYAYRVTEGLKLRGFTVARRP